MYGHVGELVAASKGTLIHQAGCYDPLRSVFMPLWVFMYPPRITRVCVSNFDRLLFNFNFNQFVRCNFLTCNFDQFFNVNCFNKNNHHFCDNSLEVNKVLDDNNLDNFLFLLFSFNNECSCLDFFHRWHLFQWQLECDFNSSCVSCELKILLCTMFVRNLLGFYRSTPHVFSDPCDLRHLCRNYSTHVAKAEIGN